MDLFPNAPHPNVSLISVPISLTFVANHLLCTYIFLPSFFPQLSPQKYFPTNGFKKFMSLICIIESQSTDMPKYFGSTHKQTINKIPSTLATPCTSRKPHSILEKQTKNVKTDINYWLDSIYHEGE